jgi:hypothetical protein
MNNDATLLESHKYSSAEQPPPHDHTETRTEAEWVAQMGGTRGAQILSNLRYDACEPFVCSLPLK